MINSYGQTIGQKLNNLKLLKNDGSKPSSLNIIYRFFIYNLGITTLVSLFTIFIREDKKSITDLVCDNKFVAVDSKKPFVLISTIASIGLTVIYLVFIFATLKP